MLSNTCLIFHLKNYYVAEVYQKREFRSFHSRKAVKQHNHTRITNKLPALLSFPSSSLSVQRELSPVPNKTPALTNLIDKSHCTSTSPSLSYIYIHSQNNHISPAASLSYRRLRPRLLPPLSPSINSKAEISARSCGTRVMAARAARGLHTRFLSRVARCHRVAHIISRYIILGPRAQPRQAIRGGIRFGPGPDDKPRSRAPRCCGCETTRRPRACALYNTEKERSSLCIYIYV